MFPFFLQTKDVALNIAIAQSIVLTVLGHEPDTTVPDTDKSNPYCDDKQFGEFLNSIIIQCRDLNPASRHSTGIWLLALIKNCSKREAIYKRKDILQYAFTELLSDDSGMKRYKQIFYLVVGVFFTPRNSFTDDVYYDVDKKDFQNQVK